MVMYQDTFDKNPFHINKEYNDVGHKIVNCSCRVISSVRGRHFCFSMMKTIFHSFATLPLGARGSKRPQEKREGIFFKRMNKRKTKQEKNGKGDFFKKGRIRGCKRRVKDFLVE